MSQAALGEWIGRTQACVSYWCSGRTEPNLSDLLALAEVFDVTTDYLLGREDS